MSVTEPFQLGISDAAAAMRKAIAEHGEDFRYVQDNCRYGMTNGAPSCAVGQILVTADHDGPTWRELVRSRYNQEAILTLIGDGWVETDTRTGMVLALLQEAQDGEWPWGYAARPLFALDEGQPGRYVLWTHAEGLGRRLAVLSLEHALALWPFDSITAHTAADVADEVVEYSVVSYGRAASALDIANTSRLLTA